MNPGRISLIIFLLFFNTYILAEENSGTKIVTATGVASMTNDKVEARNLALNDALRKAVEQAVGIIISSSTVVENFQLLNDNVYSHTEGYIKSYKITDEKNDYNTYQLTVEAEVGLGKLESDLASIGLINQKKGKPRIIVVVAEPKQNNVSPAENKLKSILKEKGFNVLESISEITQYNSLLSKDNLSAVDVQSLGKTSQAEVVIFGKAMVSETGTKRGNVGSYAANITATAFRADNAEILASAKAQSVSRHVDAVSGSVEASEKAAAELAEALINQIVQKWGQEISGTISVKLTVEGIKDYSYLAEVSDFFKKEITGVAKVFNRSFADGIAVMDIDLRGITTENFADKAAAKKFKNFKLKVTGLSSNAITLTVELN